MIISNTFLDYPDNSSHALIVFMTGCDFHCENCQNKEMQIHNKPKLNPKELYEMMLKESKKYGNTNKLVLSGGDPLSITNIKYTREFLDINKYFDICVYTGHDFNSVPKDLKNFEFIKLGQYKKELKQEQIKNNEFMQFASSNQILINSKYENLIKEGKYYYVR